MVLKHVIYVSDQSNNDYIHVYVMFFKIQNIFDKNIRHILCSSINTFKSPDIIMLHRIQKQLYRFSLADL